VNAEYIKFGGDVVRKNTAGLTFIWYNLTFSVTQSLDLWTGSNFLTLECELSGRNQATFLVS
jgi:hypothetical protein